MSKRWMLTAANLAFKQFSSLTLALRQQAERKIQFLFLMFKRKHIVKTQKRSLFQMEIFAFSVNVNL